ncbi:hypothetical protein KAFR_0F00720 [Kazachstania africana CBS 2517]|uniref:TOM70 n=1 Tax=Kazachstania africana (strain ATCC 22294 / BCRC 22015 / CBS 2517 / CECT 1963 / NBRC 1671 / NRRL Y-8276) TaxID=1071382 RepID=H2AWB9_KAZAF|nr:hypothetical protein KAFR_0F00720 [Kazachstania africana CBS 2517]CCF58669.1 hypothetical protein KAFR_0F00720 [Kazachstania africana CBS 2517]
MPTDSGASQGGIGSFITRHRTAILATLAAGATAASAYYYYNNLRELKDLKDHDKQAEDKSENATEKKLASKPKKKKVSKASQFPAKENGEPDFTGVDNLTADQKDKWAIELKDKGNEYFKEKDYENALKFYDFALILKKDPVFYSNMSACYVSLNELDKVIEMSTKALELKPDYSKALLRRATANEQLENYSDAMFDLSVLSLNNDFNGATIEPMLERNLNKQAIKVLDQKSKNPSKNESELPSNTSMASFFSIFTPEISFDSYDEESDADKELLNGLKELYSAKTGCYEIAESSFNKSMELYKILLESTEDKETISKKFAIALEYVGIFNFLRNDLVTAQDLFNQSISASPRVNSYIYLALISADKNEKDESNKYFDEALKLDPNCSPIYYHRGQLNFVTQDYVNAKNDFLKAKELDENNIFPYIQLACLSYREGDFEDCQNQFELARKKFPVAPEIPTFLGEILADKGDLDLAAKQYEFGIRLENTQKSIHVGIAPLIGKATALARQPTPENFSEASKLLQDAVEKDPRSEQAIVGLAQLKLQEEDVDTAIELFEKASDYSRSMDEKLQATTFAEAAKVQKRIRADPVIKAKVEETLAQYHAQGFM